MLDVFLIPPLLILSIHLINVRICIHLVVVKVLTIENMYIRNTSA